MKRLLIIGLIVLLASVTAGYNLGHTPNKPAAKPPVVNQATIKKPPVANSPVFHVGDTQTDGQTSLTLANVFTSNQQGATVITFQITDETVGWHDLFNQSLIYTSDGQYLKPTTSLVFNKACSGTCLTFIMPSNALADSFLYKDFKWYL